MQGCVACILLEFFFGRHTDGLIFTGSVLQMGEKFMEGKEVPIPSRNNSTLTSGGFQISEDNARVLLLALKSFVALP